MNHQEKLNCLFVHMQQSLNIPGYMPLRSKVPWINHCTWRMVISAIKWLKTQTYYCKTLWSVSLSKAVKMQ